jgi:thiol-disulfide isomerase/thioredoxin
MQMIIISIIICGTYSFDSFQSWGSAMWWLRASVNGIALWGAMIYSSNLLAAPSIHQFELEAVGQTADVALQDYAGKPLLLTFFEPACSWCVRQLRDLVKLQQAFDGGLHVVAVGVHGRKPALDKVLARSGARGRLTAALASPSLLSAIGGVPATPYTLIISPEGRFETLIRGYESLEKLNALLEDRFGAEDERGVVSTNDSH